MCTHTRTHACARVPKQQKCGHCSVNIQNQCSFKDSLKSYIQGIRKSHVCPSRSSACCVRCGPFPPTNCKCHGGPGHSLARKSSKKGSLGRRPSGASSLRLSLQPRPRLLFIPGHPASGYSADAYGTGLPGHTFPLALVRGRRTNLSSDAARHT